MPKYTIGIEDVHKIFERDAKTIRKDSLKYVRKAMRESKSYIKAKTPEVTSELKGSWHYRVKMRGAVLFNDAPYAAVVELGARPHSVSMEGIENIKMWAMEKYGYSEKEATNVAFGYAKRLKKEGQKPTYFVENEKPELMRIFAKWSKKAWEERHNARY